MAQRRAPRHPGRTPAAGVLARAGGPAPCEPLSAPLSAPHPRPGVHPHPGPAGRSATPQRPSTATPSAPAAGPALSADPAGPTPAAGPAGPTPAAGLQLALPGREIQRDFQAGSPTYNPHLSETGDLR